MTYYLLKISVSTLLIVLISEIAKRYSFASALLASLPIISILAMTWLYIDTKDIAKVSALSKSVFWLVLPSMVLFLTLPLLLKHGINFYLSMGISMAVTVLCYLAMIALLHFAGIKL